MKSGYPHFCLYTWMEDTQTWTTEEGRWTQLRRIPKNVRSDLKRGRMQGVFRSEWEPLLRQGRCGFAASRRPVVVRNAWGAMTLPPSPGDEGLD